MILDKELILSKLIKGKIVVGECWIYKNSKKELYINGTNKLISRISLWIFEDFKFLNDNRLVCHKCKTKNCWNPNHLYLGTTGDNTKDSIKDGTFRNPNTGKEICKNGHALSGNNLYIWRDKNDQVHKWCRICRSSASLKYRIRIK